MHFCIPIVFLMKGRPKNENKIRAYWGWGGRGAPWGCGRLKPRWVVPPSEVSGLAEEERPDFAAEQPLGPDTCGGDDTVRVELSPAFAPRL